jgi:hypothetical protein
MDRAARLWFPLMAVVAAALGTLSTVLSWSDALTIGVGAGVLIILTALGVAVSLWISGIRRHSMQEPPVRWPRLWHSFGDHGTSSSATLR